MATYTIPLRRETMKVPKYKRAKKAAAAVREFVARHAKVAGSEVRIGRHLNLKLWEHGIKNPAHHVKVEIEKEKDLAKVELFGAPKEEKKPEAKKGKEKAPEAAEAEKTIDTAAAAEDKKLETEAPKEKAPATKAQKPKKAPEPKAQQ